MRNDATQDSAILSGPADKAAVVRDEGTRTSQRKIIERRGTR